MNATLHWRYRGGVAARALAAIGGGYLLSSTGSYLLARLLPLHRADAVTLATMLAFMVYPCVVMWVFAASSARRACAGVGLLSAAFWLAGRMA
ncbi:iron transporter [Massilia sp. IC2-477]|uniref:iron transporter n=1 Tax=Massilia sp. IC2-477 TaxID=2887198 RepID=UPI001D123720|nr:iron transporter [Massilia sp. IC2-477]MCC2957519.1 iron transporter [Massilia sp. IC2-477]